MPNDSKNQSGGHSHPQNSDNKSNDQKPSAKGKDTSDEKVLPSGEKAKSHEGAQEGFGSKGKRDNH